MDCIRILIDNLFFESNLVVCSNDIPPDVEQTLAFIELPKVSFHPFQ